MRVILIDDEEMAIETLAAILLDYEEVEIAGSYTSPLTALDEIEKTCPDIVFLDIEMGEANGLEFAELLMKNKGRFEIVFVTAYSDYAVDAFEINAIDYLLKPIQKRRLDKTIQRLKKKEREYALQDKSYNTLKNKLTIYSLGVFHVVDGKGEQVRWRTKKTKELFAYLWMNNGNFVNKMKIIETIFGDKDFSNASTLLYTTIYQLRKSLEKLGYESAISYINDGYQLKITVKNDIEELNTLLSMEEHTEKQINNMLKLYKGDFLEEEGYDWAIGYQQWYKKLVFQSLERFAVSNLERRRLTPVLEDCLNQMHKMDVFNENVAKMIIKYYGRQKDREKLKSFFRAYEETLLEELNLKPMESTISLYKNNMQE